MIEAMGLKQAFFHFRKSELVRKIPLKIVKIENILTFAPSSVYLPRPSLFCPL